MIIIASHLDRAPTPKPLPYAGFGDPNSCYHGNMSLGDTSEAPPRDTARRPARKLSYYDDLAFLEWPIQ
jgi:hypothetical protein